MVNGIPKGTRVTLESHGLFRDHLSFLELNFTLGDTSAIVQTKKPLDAEVLDEWKLQYTKTILFQIRL